MALASGLNSFNKNKTANIDKINVLNQVMLEMMSAQYASKVLCCLPFSSSTQEAQ